MLYSQEKYNKNQESKRHSIHTQLILSEILIKKNKMKSLYT
jgi:hypothetical protein